MVIEVGACTFAGGRLMCVFAERRMYQGALFLLTGYDSIYSPIFKSGLTECMREGALSSGDRHLSMGP